MFRRRAVSVTDRRVRTMNEVLTCIKLIKMYAWEESFEKTVTGCLSNLFHLLMTLWNVVGIPSSLIYSYLIFSNLDIRKKEKLLLQKAGYVQSLNSSFTTMVPTLATILTFIVHTALKLPLLPSTVSAKTQICLYSAKSIKHYQSESLVPERNSCFYYFITFIIN